MTNKDYQPYIYCRATKSRIPVSQEEFDAFYKETSVFRRRQQRHGYCICPRTKWHSCDTDCDNCPYRMQALLLLPPPLASSKSQEECKMKNSKKNQSTTYTYWRWDEESKRTLPITITAGQDGVTEEHIIMLSDFDHAADLGDRYEKENRDYGTENKKSKFETDPENSTGEPIENLETSATDPAYILFEEKVDVPNPLVEQLLTLMEKLTPQQIDLIYDLFGSGRQLTEIANEEGVSTTAIHNRKSKIIARLRKLFAEQGIL